MIRRAISGARFAASGSVIPKPSWAQAAWFIDPQNVTGLASDNNDGKTSLTPVRTWNGGVLRRLGTYEPRIRQTTVHTFLSSHTDNTDPVIYNPIILNGAQISIQGALPTASATGVLGVVTAKSAATNTLLSATTMPGTAAVGQLVVNVTRGNSRAWVEKLLGAPSVQFSQPFVPAPIPLTVPTAENNAWATGDTVNVFSLVAVNIVEVAPTFGDEATPATNALAIYQLQVFDPKGGGLTFDPVNIGPCANMIECDVLRTLCVGADPGLTIGGSLMQNCGFRSGVVGGASVALIGPGSGPFFLNGGYVLQFMGIRNAHLDGDVIVGATIGASIQDGGIGQCAVDTGVTLSISGIVNARSGSLYASSIIYGAGTFNVTAPGRLIYPSGAGAAVAAFPLTPRIQLNGANTGHSNISGAPDVQNAIGTITAANLDAAAGVAGYGGNAFNFGGSSIQNLPA